MRKLSKKISMLMVLAMLVSLFSGIVSASAASIWSFYDRTADVVVERNATYVMEKDQYANFDLFREGKDVSKAKDKFTVKWESSDPDVVYVDPTNGRLRADKYGKAEAGDTAVISAIFTNETTGVGPVRRSFKIQIAEDEVVVPEVEYTIDVNFGDEVMYTGKKYDLTATVKADGKEIEAKVAFSIDGKAVEEFAPTEAGEYTIVATTTIDGEEYAAEIKVEVQKLTAEIVSVFQKDLDTLLVAFNDASFAKKAADAVGKDSLNIENVFELTFNADKDDAKGGDRVDHELFKAAVSADNAAVVEIDAYKPLEENLTYKIAYLENGKEVTYDYIVGSGKIPASIDVVSDSQVVVEKDTAMKWVVKNNKGVDITAWYDRDLYTHEWKIVDEDDVNSYVDVNAGTIYFFEKNKTTKVGIVLDMGYDDDGNAKKLEAFGAFTSVDKTATQKPNAFAIVPTDTATNNSGIVWGTAFDLYVGEGQGDVLELYAKYTQSAADGTPSTVFIVNGSDGTTTYTYQSSNTDIVAVDEEYGYVYPVAVGSARIYIKKDGIVIGAASVTVHKEAVFSSFDVSANTTKLSVIGDGYQIANQKIDLTATLKDKLGRNISLDDVDITWELISPNKIVDTNKVEYDLDDVFVTPVFAVNNGANKAVIKADQTGPLGVGAGEVLVKNKATKSFRVKFTATYTDDDGKETKLYDFLTFTVKNTTGVEDVNTDLKVPSFNTYIGDVNKDSFASYRGKIEAVQTDSQGYYIDTIAIDEVLLDPTEAVAVTDGYITLVISKDNKALDTEKAPIITEGTYAVTVDTIWADNNELKKAEAGVYKVQLFEGTGAKARRVKFANMIVKNEGPAYSVLKLKEWITDYTQISTLGNAVEFRLGDGKVELTDAIVTNVTPNIDYNRTDTHRVYIYSFDIEVNVDALLEKLSNNGKHWNNHDTSAYFVEKIVFNKTFTIK